MKAVLCNTILVQFVETTSWHWYLFTEERQWIFLQMFEQTALLNYCKKMNGTTELRKKQSRTIIFKILYPFQSFLAQESYITQPQKLSIIFFFLIYVLFEKLDSVASYKNESKRKWQK